MKTMFTITVETNNMTQIFNTDNPEEFKKENNITAEVEEELHTAVKMFVKQMLTEESLTDAILNEYITDCEVTTLDGSDDLSDYGSIKVTLTDMSTDNIQPETLIEVIRQPDESDDVVVTTPELPKSDIDDEEDESDV